MKKREPHTFFLRKSHPSYLRKQKENNKDHPHGIFKFFFPHATSAKKQNARDLQQKKSATYAKHPPALQGRLGGGEARQVWGGGGACGAAWISAVCLLGGGGVLEVSGALCVTCWPALCVSAAAALGDGPSGRVAGWPEGEGRGGGGHMRLPYLPRPGGRGRRALVGLRGSGSRPPAVAGTFHGQLAIDVLRRPAVQRHGQLALAVDAGENCRRTEETVRRGRRACAGRECCTTRATRGGLSVPPQTASVRPPSPSTRSAAARMASANRSSTASNCSCSRSWPTPSASRPLKRSPGESRSARAGLSGKKQKKRLHNANRNKRSRGRARLHGPDMGRTQNHRKQY